MKTSPRKLYSLVRFGLLAGFLAFSAPSPAWGRATETHSGGRPVLLHIGPSVWISNATALGVNTSFSTRIHDQHPLFLGADLGLMVYLSPASVALPILASIYYKFPNQSQVTPVIGMNTGMVVMFGSVNNASFAFFFKPGIEMHWSSTSNLFVEMRLGAIGSAFVFNPIVGLAFAL